MVRFISSYTFALTAALLLTGGLQSHAFSQDSAAEDSLRREVVQLEKKLTEVEERSEQRYQALLRQVAQSTATTAATASAAQSNFTFGGYGEVHWQGGIDNNGSYADIHRWVLYLGYSFADWVQFHSETELEHALVEKDNGKVEIEQMYIEFQLSRKLGLRIGRLLVPAGIINSRHEPPTFYSVERPSLEADVIPSTWSTDGFGLYGGIGGGLTWEASLTNSLNGEGFKAMRGIRGGRMSERPGWREPALIGRADYGRTGGLLDAYRIGIAAFRGGATNANRDSGIKYNDATATLWAADLEARQNRVELRGVVSGIDIGNARNLNKNRDNDFVAESIFGWYGELAWHAFPNSWKSGRLIDADLALFGRYQFINSQASMPEGYDADPAGERTELTFGLAFLPTPQVALKADYSLTDNAADEDPSDHWNLGIGWQF